MNSRRRANNRGRGRGTKTNLDDLDGVLSGMIRPQANVKTVVDPAEERRFTMHSSMECKPGVFSSHMTGKAEEISGGHTPRTGDFEKHQVNYSDTKYIKP